MNSYTICKNCASDFRGIYCPTCKQPANTARITWNELGHHAIHAFLHVDRGFLYTVSEMFVRPGKTIQNYFEGKRGYHFNPFFFLILLGGITSVLFSAFHINVIVKKVLTESIEKVNPFFAHKHFTIIGAVILLFLTLTDFIFYRKKKYTLPELLVSNAFQIGEMLLFLILSLPFLYLQNYINDKYDFDFEIRYIILCFFYCYLFFVRYQIYYSKPNYVLIVKIIFQLILLGAVVQYRIATSIIENL
ncbi:DUF3667 domain-containing protein [Flavobacterium sp. LAR06]|uniref:DUF3667 domain-containing protein n=1 Tax=Flavobacterium sp. LAR06 TaxID=3064897 RepID=UPI0035C1D970